MVPKCTKRKNPKISHPKLLTPKSALHRRIRLSMRYIHHITPTHQLHSAKNYSQKTIPHKNTHMCSDPPYRPRTQTYRSARFNSSSLLNSKHICRPPFRSKINRCKNRVFLAQKTTLSQHILFEYLELAPLGLGEGHWTLGVCSSESGGTLLH